MPEKLIWRTCLALHTGYFFLDLSAQALAMREAPFARVSVCPCLQCVYLHRVFSPVSDRLLHILDLFHIIHRLA